MLEGRLRGVSDEVEGGRELGGLTFDFPFSLLRPVAMSPAEVTEKLSLHKMKDRSWYVHPR